MRPLTPLENLALAKDYVVRYKAIANFPYQPQKSIREFQFSRIKALVNLAYHQTDFYHDLYAAQGIHPEDIRNWKDFEQLPTISKDDVIANQQRCIVRTHRGDKRLITSRSSGSSGQIINVVFSGESWVQQALIALRMFQSSFGVMPLDKQAFIYTSKYPYRSILGLYRAQYVYTLTPPAEIIETLKIMRPAVLVAYPSILLELLALSEATCRDLGLKAISTNSEHSTQAQRNFIAQGFNCPVFDEYSTEELAMVAYQCKYHRYHLQEDCTYIETLRLDSDKPVAKELLGEIVGTCLVNNVMPLIRYRQGDLGTVQSSHCRCGQQSRLLSNLAGRKNAAFTLADGKVIASGRILDWTYKLFLEFKIPILQFQVLQVSRSSIEITVIPGASYHQDAHDSIICTSFKKEFGNFLDITLRKVTSIAKTPAGKHMPIQSLVPFDH